MTFKNLSTLIDYLRNDLKPESVNQAAIIMYLLEHGGRATKADLIRHLARFNDPITVYYEGVLARATMLDLEDRDVFTYDPKTENYFLNVSLTDTYLTDTALKLCRNHVNNWQDRHTSDEFNSQGKLVRDRIPEIIAASGRTAVTETLDGQELHDALIAKLTEEHVELLQETNMEEIADVIEVLLGLARGLGHDEEAVMDYVRERRAARGAFEDGTYLRRVVENTPATEAK
ncbi:MAG: nucleoside triphosphate pyrophosphohydrolase [Chloroflexota bacterium]